MEDAEHPESLKERIPFYNGFDGTGWCHRNYSSGYYVNAVFGCIEILRILAGRYLKINGCLYRDT